MKSSASQTGCAPQLCLVKPHHFSPVFSTAYHLLQWGERATYLPPKLWPWAKLILCMPFLLLLWKKNNLAHKAASTSHQYLTSWRGDGVMDQSNIGASLNIKSVYFSTPYPYPSQTTFFFEQIPLPGKPCSFQWHPNNCLLISNKHTHAHQACIWAQVINLLWLLPLHIPLAQNAVPPPLTQPNIPTCPFMSASEPGLLQGKLCQGTDIPESCFLVKSHFKTRWAPRQLPQQPVVTSRCRTALSGLVTYKKNTARRYLYHSKRDE